MRLYGAEQNNIELGFASFNIVVLCSIIRDYYMTFSALVLARDSHIKPDSAAGGLILKI
jgi:hypothetical protein